MTSQVHDTQTTSGSGWITEVKQGEDSSQGDHSVHQGSNCTGTSLSTIQQVWPLFNKISYLYCKFDKIGWFTGACQPVCISSWHCYRCPSWRSFTAGRRHCHARIWSLSMLLSQLCSRCLSASSWQYSLLLSMRCCHTTRYVQTPFNYYNSILLQLLLFQDGSHHPVHQGPLGMSGNHVRTMVS